MGDAGLLADPGDPDGGVIFDGRVSEDFKLTTGTWVSVGTLRVRAVSALSPYAMDVVVAGHDRDEIGLMIFPAAPLRQLAGDAAGALCGKSLGSHPAVQEALAAVLAPNCAGRGLGAAARARGAAVGAAVDRGGRDHRQGLYQPAPCWRAAPMTRRGCIRTACR